MSSVTMCKTVCANCKHHVAKDQASGRKDYMYNHFCAHPDCERPKEQCPVTGKIGYATRNDLGVVSIGDLKYPNCNQINNGNCELYESS